MKLKITLFYTDICNINCTHCFLGTSKNRGRMETEMLQTALEEVSSEKISVLSISGGEPLLFWDDIKVPLSDYKHFRTTISTNGFWAKTKQDALAFCNDLKVHGIDIIEISSDVYHQEHIPFEYIKNAVQAAMEIGMDYKIITCLDATIPNIVSSHHFRELIIITQDLKKIIVQRVAGYGEAKVNKLGTCYDESFFYGKRCPHIAQPCINYRGYVFSCCGPDVNNDNSPLCIGNITNSSLREIIQNMQTHKVLCGLKEMGPYNFWTSYKKTSQRIQSTSLCDFCISSMTVVE